MKTIIRIALFSALIILPAKLYAVEIGGDYSLEESIRLNIENSRLGQYRQNMSYLLQTANTEDFLRAVFAAKNSIGYNMFHLMAGVQDPEAQEFFARETETLLSVFTGKALPNNASIAGLPIDPPPLEDIPLVGDFLKLLAKTPETTGFTENDLLPLREGISRIANGPAIDFIRFLYAKNRQGLTLGDILPKITLEPITPIEDVAERVMKLRKPFKRSAKKGVLRKATRGGLSGSGEIMGQPLDIALARGNVPVYQVLRSFGADGPAGLNWGGQLFAGSMPFNIVMWTNILGFEIGWSPQLAVTAFLAATAGAVVTARMCQKAVRGDFKMKRLIKERNRPSSPPPSQGIHRPSYQNL